MKVLAHHRSPISRCSSGSVARAIPFLFMHPCFVFIIAVFRSTTAHAQVLFNGQVFTNGLAIVDAPAPNSQLHAGSSLDFAVDVSGNGKLAEIAGSAGFDSLNVFLVSTSTNINLTVTDSPQFLLQEVGSTVKHLNWAIQSCIPPGPYNLTLYETFHLQGGNFFSITAIPLRIENDGPGGGCTSQNAVDTQQQPFSSLARNPWLDGTVSAVSVSALSSVTSGPATVDLGTSVPAESKSAPVQANSPSATFPPAPSYAPSFLASSVATPGIITVTIGPQGVQWPLTVGPPTVPDTIVIEQATSTMSGLVTVVSVEPLPAVVTAPAGSAFGTVTVMVSPTAVAMPVTVVFVSVGTFTTTTTGAAGSSTVYTATSTSLSTTMGVMGTPSTGNSDYAGFLPINAVSSGPSVRIICSTVLFLPLVIPLLSYLM